MIVRDSPVETLNRRVHLSHALIKHKTQTMLIERTVNATNDRTGQRPELGSRELNHCHWKYENDRENF